MSFTVLITLTTAGGNTGPFDLYSDADGYVTAFETNIAKSTLVAGYTSNAVPDGSTIIRVKSNNVTCSNYVALPISGLPNPTPTPTPTNTPFPAYTTLHVYSGSTATAACAQTNSTYVYYTGSLVVGTTIFWDSPTLSNQVPNGWYSNADSDALYQVTGSDGKVSSSTLCTPYVTPTPSATPPHYNKAIPTAGAFYGGNGITCGGLGSTVIIYMNDTDYATWSTNGQLLIAGMTLYSSAGVLYSYNRVYDPTATTIYNVNSGIVGTVPSGGYC